MRELERDYFSETPACTPDCERIAVVGRGRMGGALARALRNAGWSVSGPLGRGARAEGCAAVLLCVPDAEIAGAAELVAPGALVGHCSGATGLEVLAPHEGFSLHPLMTVADQGGVNPLMTVRDQAGVNPLTTEVDQAAVHPFAGAGAAIAGATPRALGLARSLARSLELRPVEIAAEDRVAYHAAASIASNFLITLEAAAERMAASTGVERELMIPLVRTTIENWSRLGSRRALTGPVARGDERTVALQREAVAERMADLLPLFDALTDATRVLAGGLASAIKPEASPAGQVVSPESEAAIA